MSNKVPLPRNPLRSHTGEEAREHVNARAAENEPTIPEPEPWPSPPDEAAYQGLVGDIVRKIEPETEADPVAVLIQVLAMFGNVVGRSAHFKVEEDKHFGNIFACLVGETAKGRKGTSKGRALKVFESLEDDWLVKRLASGLSSGEGLIWAVRDEIKQQQPIKEKGHVTGYEEVVVDPGVSDKRLLIVESEFVLALRSAGREGNTLSARMREAWDHGTLTTLTKNTQARATGAHISIIGHITRGELVASMRETDTINGFANRFLWCAVRRSKLLPLGGMPVDLGPLAHKIALAAERAKNTGETPFDGPSAEIWCEDVYPRLAAPVAGVLGAVTNRAEAQVRRLALLYALLDFSPFVKPKHLAAGLAVWQYCERSARWVWGGSTGNSMSDVILEALRDAGDDGLSSTEISGLFGRHADRTTLGKAMATLVDADLAHCRDVQTKGRPMKRWYAGAKKAKEAN